MKCGRAKLSSNGESDVGLMKTAGKNNLRLIFLALIFSPKRFLAYPRRHNFVMLHGCQ